MMSNNKYKTFFENISWTFIGSLIYALSQWLLIVILAKLGSAEIVGQFSLGLAITAPIILFSNMQLRNIIATDSTNEYQFSEYLGTRIILLMIGLFVIVLFVSIGAYNLTVSSVIILVGISKVFESLSDLTHGYFQKIERMDYAGKSLIYKAFSSIIAFSLIFYFTKKLNYALIGLIIAWVLRLFLYDLKYTKKYVSIIPQISNFKKIVVFSLPLGLFSILNSVNTNIPRYFLEGFIGLEELGYFSAISYILVVGNLLIRPLSLVAAPRLAKSFQENKLRKYLKILGILMLSGIFIGVIVLVIVYNFGENILSIVYGKDYGNYTNIFLILISGSVFNYLTKFINTAIVATRRFRFQPLVIFITLIIGLISSILLIPKFGIIGAAYVTLISFITSFVGSLLYLLIILKRNY